MNSSAPTPPSNPVAQPPVQDFGSLYTGGVNAAIASAPGLQQTNYAAITGQGPFAGSSVADLSKYYDQVSADSANRNAGADLATQQKFGSGFNQVYLDSLKQIDPGALDVRNKLESSLSAGLDAGAGLDEATRKQIEQQVLGEQTVRNNVSGLAPAIEQGLTTGAAGLALQQQRQGAAQSYINGGQITGPASSAPSPFQGQVAAPLTQVTPAAGTAAANYGLGVLGDQSGMYNAGLGYSASNYKTAAGYESPWMGLLGTALGAGIRGAAAYGTGGASLGLGQPTMPIPRATLA